MRKLFLLIFLTFFFSVLVFIIRGYFLFLRLDDSIEVMPSSHDHDEIIGDVLYQSNDIGKKPILDLATKHFGDKQAFSFAYFPSDFREEVSGYTEVLSLFLGSNIMNSKIDTLGIDMYKTLFDVRGKMANRTLKLFGVLEMTKSEFLAVGIHEFAHYIDLYFLQKSVIKDVSEYFYSLSWDATKIIKPGLQQKDFVSGYAMTNKYEDFSESFTYYVLHNNDFAEKSTQSDILKQKYDFFTRNLFSGKEFIGTDFSTHGTIKDYYRDITKIDFSFKKLLIFLEHGI